MRIAHDFAMYYANTYIGYRAAPDGPVIPFYVENVEWSGDGPPWDDEDEPDYEARDGWYDSEEYNDYSKYAYDNITFYGYLVTNIFGNTENFSITGFHSPELEFRNPLLGFVKTSHSNRDKIWMTYQVNRSVKKGLSNNRVTVGLNGTVAWQAFEQFDSDRTVRDFFFEESTGFIKYRHNVVIATKDPDIDLIYLDPLAEHLKGDLEELYPRCQIQIEEL